MSSLTDIATPVRAELQEFRTHFKNSMISSVKLVDLVARFLVRQKGKKVRPMLVLLAAKACGGVNERSFTAATLVELLHTATLVHDDVVDESATRRGFPSLQKLWGNKVAVLMGDFLLSRGLLVTVDHDEYEFLRITSHAVRRMSEGELSQIRRARKAERDEAGYFKTIADKTASLFSACCELGAESAAPVEHRSLYREALRAYGELVGIAFQIRDDILDYESRWYTLGKPTSQDVAEKKVTLPLIYALDATPDEADRIMNMVKRGATARQTEEIVRFVHESGGIERARATALEYAGRAREEIMKLPASAARVSLDEFITFVTERTR